MIIKRLIPLLLLLAAVTILPAENKGWKFLQSIAVPGLSQIRDGRHYGYAMLTSEVGIISSMLYLNTEEKLKTQEYYEYAIKYAHIGVGEYPDQYFRDLSRYSSSGYDAGGYNAQVRETAIQLFPYDTTSQQAYINEHAYTDGQSWNWDSVDNRSAYSKIRVQTQDLRDYSKLAVGVLIVNHLISGIDVLRLISESNRSQVYLDIKDKTPTVNLRVEW
jgi:hypothetical protein